MASFDTRNGSWGGGAQVPAADDHRVPAPPDAPGGDARFGAMARFTLEKMADGGIHDQLGGGFHRYATDTRWLVPHFEQMLYDNAQLARVYLHAVGGDRRARGSATWPSSVLEYMLRELAPARRLVRLEPGRRYRGRRGADVRVDRGRDPRRPRRRRGAVHGRVRRHRRGQLGGPDDPLAGLAGHPHAAAIARGRRPSRRGSPTRGRGCSRVDATRSQPPRDDKALAAWNGLAIGALRRRGPAPRRTALRGRGVSRGRGDHGRPARPRTDRSSRSWKDGRATGQGVLEDYADLAEGLLALYEATVRRALVHDGPRADGSRAGPLRRPGRRLLRHRRRPRAPRHPAQGPAGQRGPVGQRDGGPRPAATGGVDRRGPLSRRGRAGVPHGRRVSGERYPTGFAQWLVALDLAFAPAVEVAIVGDPSDPATQALLAETTRGYPAAPGRGGQRDARDLRDPVARGSRRDRRPTDGLRLPRVRVPAAGDRSRGPPRGAGDRGWLSARADRRARRSRPRPAATVVLMRPGPVGARGPPGPAAGIDGLRPGCPRLPRRSRRSVRCASERRRPLRPLARGCGGVAGRRPRPDRRRSRRSSRRSARSSRRPASCWPTARRRRRGCWAPRGPPWSAARSGSRRWRHSST